MESPAPTAPAQPAVPDVDPGPGPSAPSAPARIDTGAYLRDRRDQDAKPTAPSAPAPTEPKAAPADPAAPAQPVSKRQQVINDYERQLAEARERIARLEGRIEQPVAPAAPAPPAEKPVTQAEYKRYLALPDAPKLDDFESIAEHTAAMALFIADQRWNEHSSRARAHAESAAMTDAQRQRADGFAGRMKEASTADPEFWNAVSPEVANLQPLGALKPGQPAGPANLVAEELLSSPVAPQLMRELSKPGALARLIQGPEGLDRLPPRQRPAEHARWIVRELGKLEATIAAPAPPSAPAVKTVPDHEPPPTRLGSKPNVPADPVEAALKRKDTGAYLEERRAQDLARMGKR